MISYTNVNAMMELKQVGSYGTNLESIYFPNLFALFSVVDENGHNSLNCENFLFPFSDSYHNDCNWLIPFLKLIANCS